MNHEEVHKNILEEHDALWEAISSLEDTVTEQRKEIDRLNSGKLSQVNQENQIDARTRVLKIS